MKTFEETIETIVTKLAKQRSLGYQISDPASIKMIAFIYEKTRDEVEYAIQVKT